MIDKALDRLGYTAGIDYLLRDDGHGPYIKEWFASSAKPTDEMIAKAVKDVEAEEYRLGAARALMQLCDDKSRAAKNYIAGQYVSDEQLRRYEEKYMIAKEYKASGNYSDMLALEANIKGMAVDQLADAIIAAGDAYKDALIGYNTMIEAFRVKVKAMIDAGDIDTALTLIEKAKQLDATTTAADIEQIFSTGS